ncbi:MAG: Z1 domain-containing protein, partial [Burkholderiales bacterium]|nr:Z1 domain-containing protein [Burkholderiales bacterium]
RGIEEQPELPLIDEVDDYIDYLGSDENDGKKREGWMPPKVKQDHVPLYRGEDKIPPSLEVAIKEYILSCATRHIREGHSIANSMLIHVTRLGLIQGRVADQVKEALRNIQSAIRRDPKNAGIFIELEELWITRFIPKNEHFERDDLKLPSWDDIKAELRRTAEKIVVREVNGYAKEALEYRENEKQGFSVIAVGGEKLSRGLVLKGLTVSYFLRTTNLFDTLMQMGRWFGYKHHYIDVCRLYLTSKLLESYQGITNASAELREHFEYMVATGATPDRFGMRVRSFPGLLPTSKAKSQHATKQQVSFENTATQTIIFDRSKKTNRNNLDAVTSLIEKLGNPAANKVQTRSGGFMWRDIYYERIIEFLDTYETHKDAEKVQADNIKRYISQQAGKDELTNWTVVIASKKISASSDGKSNDFSNYFWNLSIGGLERKNVDSNKDENRIVIKTLISPADESSDLDDAAYASALRKTKIAWEKKIKKKSTSPPSVPSGCYIREMRNKQDGHIMIYPLKIENIQYPVIGIALSFPASATAKAISYYVPRYQDSEAFL